MEEGLKKFFSNFGIKENEISTIQKNIYPLKISKGEIFCKKGKVCDVIGILLSGILFAEYSNGDKKIISRFFFLPDNLIVTSFDSFNDRTVSMESIIAHENSYLFCIRYNDLMKLYEEIPALNKLGRILAEISYVKALQRAHDLQTLTSKQRLLKFKKKYEDFYYKLGRSQVSSYLGMDDSNLRKLEREILRGQKESGK